MTRVTYGVSSSPFQSTRCLFDILDPELKHHIRHGFYVFDFFGSCSSVEEARTLIKKLCDELNKTLPKCVSNNPKLIEEMPMELRESADNLELFSKDYQVKALGMFWKPNQNIFVFKAALERPKMLTNRNMLSQIAKLFDPHGFISPVVFKFKMLI